MLALLVLIVLVAASFGAGYGTRELVSRKRRAKYLQFKPYLPPPRKRNEPPAFLVQAVADNETFDPDPALQRQSRRSGDDITRSFQDLQIQERKRGGANLHACPLHGNNGPRARS